MKIRSPMQIKSSEPCEIYRKKANSQREKRSVDVYRSFRVLFGGCFDGENEMRTRIYYEWKKIFSHFNIQYELFNRARSKLVSSLNIRVFDSISIEKNCYKTF